MITYVYDGKIDGIFSCLFHYFTQRKNDDVFLSENQTQLSFSNEIIAIETDYEANKRVISALYKYAGLNLLNDVRYAFRSGESRKATVIFNYLKKTLQARANVSDKFSDKNVLDFYDLIKRISLEVHRFKGFLRFNESAEGILYAKFSPDNDIADLLLPHFSARLGKTPFGIHDVKRNKVSMHCGNLNKTVYTDKINFVAVDENESAIGSLWRDYYDSVNIKERKNEKVMLAFMPARYHENLPERNRQIAR